MLLKSIPKVDKFITNKAFEGLSKTLITKITKEVLENLRVEILNKKIDSFDEQTLISNVLRKYENLIQSSLKPVINATGIIVHSNLGRSLLDESLFKNAITIATSYNNLEYSLEEGKRGERYEHITKSLQALTSCEDALVVNNNASAVFLILNTFCKNKEAVLSRGELVEIGGSFRVPEVMTQSGAILKEIGTTNKTHLRDYENAINENTAMLMKVHKSNYSIEGFFSEVSFEDISKIAQKNGLIDYFDMGSGHIYDLPFNLSKDEPSILELMKSNPSLLSFSGDKLLGSVQAGIIVGKKELDKIPTLKMLNTKLEILEQRANNLKNSIDKFIKCEVIKSFTMVGGGTTPNKKIPTFALSLEYKNLKANEIEKILRKNLIISRIENDKVLLDFRTILEKDIAIIEEILKKEFKNV